MSVKCDCPLKQVKKHKFNEGFFLFTLNSSEKNRHKMFLNDAVWCIRALCLSLWRLFAAYARLEYIQINDVKNAQLPTWHPSIFSFSSLYFNSKNSLKNLQHLFLRIIWKHSHKKLIFKGGAEAFRISYPSAFRICIFPNAKT